MVGGMGDNGRRKLASRLWVGTALAACACAWCSPALAACSDTDPSNGETVTCDNASTAGVIASGANNVTVNVLDNATITPPSGQSIWLGTGAIVDIGTGATIGNTATSAYTVQLGPGANLTLEGTISGGAGIHGATTEFPDGLTNSTITISQTGQILTNGLGVGAIVGRGGGNTYNIDGLIKTTGVSNDAIIVGDGDVVNLGATGKIITMSGDSTTPIGDYEPENVTVITAAGSLIELHGLGAGIDLGANSEVTIGGLIRSYGDTYPNANSAGGAGVSVGPNSIVRVVEGGQIITGNTLGLSNRGAGGYGIVTFVYPGASNAQIFVDGLIDTQRAHGIYSAVGDKIVVGETGRITVRASADGIFGKLYTTTTDNTFTVDISGTVEQLGTGRGLWLDPSRAEGETVETAVSANVTIHEGGTLYAAANFAYSQYDGFSTYPEIIDNLIVAGTVARGTPGIAIDLNDGADKVTFLPTYSLTGNVTGGSDQGGPSNPTETDTFALDGGIGTTATFNFAANQITNFEAGQKLGAGTWTLAGTTSGLNGTFAIDAGKLLVDGTLTNVSATVASGAALGGGGALSGAVTVANGGRLLGTTGADLAMGSLVLNNTSLLDIALGAPSASALFNVTGALTLDGRLVVSDAGGFDYGSYRLISYAGALTNNGLIIQSVPVGYNPGNWSIDVGTSGQVTLIVAAGADTQYWDGSNMSPGSVANGRGGSGTWNASNSNWTNQAGTINAAWAGGKAVFASATGTSAVEVVGTQAIGGVQFLTPISGATGYVFSAGTGGALSVADAQTVFDVAGDAGGAVTEAKFGVTIGGAGGILKSGGGDLELAAANTYSGATEIDAGRLIVSATGALSGGPVTVDAGSLVFSGLGTSAGSLSITNASADAAGGVSFLTGTSAGSATIANTGLVLFSGTANAAGATIDNQSAGVVDVSGRDGPDELNIGSLSGAGTVQLGDQTLALGALDLDDTISGVIENGAGAVNGTNQLVKTGSGTLTLSGFNTYTGFTTVREGTLLVDGAVATDVGVYGGRLGGGGVIAGEVFVVEGATLLGRAGADLQMDTLALADTSFVTVALGAPSDDALFLVDGALTLDGRLIVTDAGGFGLGTYRLIDYGGTLTDNGLVIQSLPAGYNPGDWDIDAGVSGQVSLIVAQSTGTQYWDGSHMSPGSVANGRGGSGVWNTANTNWANQAGTINAPWAGQNAVFAAAGASTVTIEGAHGVTGLRFLSGADYDFIAGNGGGLTLGGSTLVALEGAATRARIAAPIGGDGGVLKSGDGTLILAGANTYAGGTTVQAGVLEVASDGALGKASGSVILDGGTLRLAADMSSARGFAVGGAGGTLDTGGNAVTLSGGLSGGGDLDRLGDGVLTYSGNGSGYSGTLTLLDGTLALSGTLGGTLVVGEDAELAGGGTFGDLVLEGTLAPGFSIGTLTATGDAIIRDGSFYDLEIAADGAADLLDVAGTVMIEGGTLRVLTLDPEGGYTDGTRYTFITAGGGLSGAFDGIEEHSAFLDFTLGYAADSAFLQIETVRTFPDVAQTFNQLEAAAALAQFDIPGDSRTVYNALLMLGADEARMAFDLASGEIYAAVLGGATRQAETAAQQLIGQARAPASEGWNLWGLVTGQTGHVGRDGNGERYEHDRIGGMIGIGYAGPDNGWAIGLGAGYWGGGIDLPGRASEADLEGWQVGGYARFGTGGAGLTATVSGGYAAAEAEVGREIAIGALSRTATAKPDLDSWALTAEARFGFMLDDSWAAGPIARVAYAESSLGRFEETGADSLDLAGLAGNGDNRMRYGAGAFARWSREAGGVELSALYSRVPDTLSEAGLQMAGAPMASFRVRAARGGRDFADLGISAFIDLGAAVTLGASAGALLGSDDQSLNGSANLKWAF